MNAPPVLSVRTQRFTVDRACYFRLLVGRVSSWPTLFSLGIVLVSAAYSTASRGAVAGLRVFLLAAVVWGAFYVPAYFQARAKVYGAGGAILDVPREFEFSDSGIAIRMDARHDSFVIWSGIQRVVCREGFVLLFTGAKRYCPVPDEAFRSPSKCEACLEIVRRQRIPVKT